MTFPERDTSTPAEQLGLFNKFYISRIDGSDCPGGKHEGCANFVVDLDHDEHAKQFAAAYAAACAGTHPQLAADLLGELNVDLKEQRNILMRLAEQVAYAYFGSCDVGPERIAASKIYDNLRNAGRVY